jgi:1-acyl-sn-glycerol-3-phosphate acyltransferase
MKNAVRQRKRVEKENNPDQKKRSIKYELVRTYVRLAFWLSHSRITVVGRKNIPSDAPIIFAPNHQNALMDPLALVCTNRLQTIWLARADIFKSKRLRPILKFLKIWPVYRIRDGKENLSNNEEIFGKVIQLLHDKQSVALFPEAAHSGKRQMLPHKKAVPRIALEAEEKNSFQLGLQIIPVGISYSHYSKFNRSLLVQYGEPLKVDDFWVDYEVNPQKALLDLRDKIHTKLESLVIDIKSRDYYDDYESIRKLAGAAYAKRKSFSKKRILQQFAAEKELMDKLWQLESQSPEDFKMLIAQLHQYQSETSKEKLTEAQIENAAKADRLMTWLKLIFALVTLPVFLAGLLFNGIPYWIPRAILKKKIKDQIFTASFNFVLGMIIFPVFYIIVYFLALHPRFPVSTSFAVLALMPFLGKAAYWLLQFYEEMIGQVVFIVGTKNYKKKTEKAIESRWKLVELILDKVNF